MKLDASTSPGRPALGTIGLFDGIFGTGTDALGPAELAEIEALGYGTIWVPNAAPDLAAPRALLEASTTVTVGTGVVSIWSTTPDALAGAAAGAGDRLVVGIGVSHAPLVQRSGRSFDRPLTRLARFLDQLAEETHAVPHERLVLGANGPAALALSRDRTAGALPYLVTPQHTEGARRILGPDRHLAPVQKVILDDDPARARALARDRLQIYWQFPNYTRNLARLGLGDADLAEGGSDRLVDALVAWGDAESVAVRIRAHHQAGADHVGIHVLRPPGEDPLPAWRALAAHLTAP